jgi:hypothetical protein
MEKSASHKIKIWMLTNSVSLEDIAQTIGFSNTSAYNLISGRTRLKTKHIHALENKYPHFDALYFLTDEKKSGEFDMDGLDYLQQENAFLRKQLEILNQTVASLTRVENEKQLEKAKSGEDVVEVKAKQGKVIQTNFAETVAVGEIH